VVIPEGRDPSARQQASADLASVVVQAGRDIRDVRVAPMDRAPIAVSIAPPYGRRDPACPLRGRAALVGRLVDLVVSPGPARPPALVLHGLGGCGKSTVAIEVAYQAAQRGVRVWWVEAADVGVFEAGMHAVARDVGAADEALRQGDAADVLWRVLQQYPSRWLLVVDNVQDLNALTVAGRPLAEGCGWVRPPPSDSGAVIVTSRDGDSRAWGAWATLCFVDVLGGTDAARVLLDHAGADAGSLADAESLATRLAGLPLALRLAGAYLHRSSTSPWRGSVASFTDYLRAYDMAARCDPVEHPLTPIDHTWDMLLEVLDRRRPSYARRLLWLLSTFADAPIPYSLLLWPAGLARSRLFPNIDGPQLWDLLLALAELGLIDLQQLQPPASADPPPQLRLHQLVRDAARRQARHAGDLEACLEVAAEMVARAAKNLGDPTDPADWSSWSVLAPHAFAILRAMAEPVERSDPADRSERRPVPQDCVDAAELSAMYLQAAGHHARAEFQFRAVLRERVRAAGPDHVATLASRHRLAYVLHDLGRYEAAQAAHEAVLRQRERILGPDHRDALVSRHHIADLLSHRGYEVDAERECRAVLDARLRTRGALDDDTLASRHQLGYILRRQGRLAEAETEYRTALRLRRERFGDDDNRTLVTRFQLADLLHRRGFLAEARTHYEVVLPARRRSHGDQHLITLLPWHGLAVLLHQQGEVGASWEAHEEVHRRIVAMFGEGHPYAAFTKEPIDHFRSVAGHEACCRPEYIATMGRLIDQVDW
jgi:tetratricopeptide (TPR) repeat protein